MAAGPWRRRVPLVWRRRGAGRNVIISGRGTIMENNGIETTRRGFLKGAALAVAGAGVAGLAGCAPQG
ncbi:twin-arginine translocation signal domain-containing protein, partial [Adlercreutzia equolifaciens]|uniref:twin-arginine translocation signal domain-containing protein n=1 Tax=Adlercreutzia equolifaciens TaxID=446660 RepID=UPI003AF0DB71